jgi:hypothetical protein
LTRNVARSLIEPKDTRTLHPNGREHFPIELATKSR